jgi:hypothetical protein
MEEQSAVRVLIRGLWSSMASNDVDGDAVMQNSGVVPWDQSDHRTPLWTEDLSA